MENEAKKDTAMSTNRSLQNSNGQFIGGAAAARKKAVTTSATGNGRISTTRRRLGATPILNPLQRQRAIHFSAQVLSIQMNPMERFFAALFRSPPQQFVDAHQSATARTSLLQEITHRVGLLPPAQIVTQHHYKAHAAALASLVLEEARYAVSEALLHMPPIPTNPTTTTTAAYIPVTLSSTKGLTPHDVLFFRKATEITPSQLYDIRPGTVFSIQQRQLQQQSKVVLGTVVNMTEQSWDDDQQTSTALNRTISLMTYQDTKLPIGGEYILTPLTGLITQVRQFEACTSNYLIRVPFVPALMGQKGATHLKFELYDEFKENDDFVPMKNVKVKPEPNIKHISDDEDSCDAPPTHNNYIATDHFCIPTLNDTQEKACRSFLNSKPASISLVQGPPGTGKTTLLVAIICRYLLQSKGKNRLLVSAPTNKAVTVLASRFMAATTISSSTEWNAVLIGDKEKLLESQPNLKAIFAYTFIDVMVVEWTKIRKVLQQQSDFDVGPLITTAKWLVTRLDQQIPKLFFQHDLVTLTNDILQKLVELFSCGTTVPMGSTLKTALFPMIELLIKALTRMNDRDVTAELLSTAHVIFCTLASAGAVMVKQTDPINDMIVDEAAAATEPELYIPFHLKPQRLLAVGDPKQLPATVTSRFAERCGLNKSLHERLMYDCQWPYIMLNVQYRMRPSISQFPSNSFYRGEIENGPNVTVATYNTPLSILNQEAYAFLQVKGHESQSRSGSYQNRDEANMVVNVVSDLAHMARIQGIGPGWCAVDRIRIITFYQAQVMLIQSMLRARGLENVMVSTVDSSQGCEADVVIVTFVRSGGHVGFLADNRRLNVALTRAKYQLICVGNASGMLDLDGAKTIQGLAKDAEARNCIRTYRCTAPPVNLDRNWKHMQNRGNSNGGPRRNTNGGNFGGNNNGYKRKGNNEHQGNMGPNKRVKRSS